MTDTQQMHARATSLAVAAMNAAAALPIVGETDYAKAQRLYAEALRDSRATGIERARAHNRDLHVQAQIRKHGGFQEALPF